MENNNKVCMRNILVLLTLVLSVLTASADPVTREQAQKKAEAFMRQQHDLRQLTPVVSNRKLSPRRRGAKANTSDEYYVFNKGTREGFVIVSGDDRTEAILGYCDEGEFDYEQIPPAMQELLDCYARQIGWLQEGGGPVVHDAIPTHPKVEQLVKSKWSQGYPYNLTCPEYFSLGRSVTGCVATAMAQLLYYNREKSVSETTAAMPAYDTWTEHPTYGRLHVEGIPEGSPIDWENMKDEYGSATEKQRRAVADLMHYCGVAAKMDYTNSSSGAQSYDAYQAFAKYFGYGSSVRYVSYSSVSSDVEWDRIIYSEISAGRPIYISGANSEGGHAFVCDGYDGNLKYHINWGWGGTSDGHYLLTSLTPGQQGIGGSNDGYTAYREIIIGIEPENYGEKAMVISDATVRSLCLQNWDTDKDGMLTYGEAAAVKDIGTVFKGTSIKSFKELYYFTGLTSLPDDAFNGCEQLASLRLPKNIQAIGARSLKGCAKLSKLELPNHVSTIGQDAFNGCRLLAAIALPDELPAIEDRSFKDCQSLTTVALPITVGKIGNEAFAGCNRLNRMDVKTFQPSAIQLGSSVFASVDLSKAVLSVMPGTKEYFTTDPQWRAFNSIVEKRELSGGKFVALEAGKKYYLYHMGTGQYLTKGEAWGTQAIVGDSPMRFTVHHTATMPEDTYYLTSEDTGQTGTLLFRTMTDTNVGTGVKAAFVDGTLSKNRTNAYWTIKSVGDGIYSIQIPKDAAGYEEGRFWGVQTSHASNFASPTNGVYADIAYDEHPTACQWRFVLYDEAAVAQYDAAQTLSNLLEIAAGRRLKTDAEKAIYDQSESSYEQLRTAQRSLRKKLKFIDFGSDVARDLAISLWDIDSDGELSYLEASKVPDFNVSFQGNTKLESLEELQYFTSIDDIYGNTFEGCSNLVKVVLPANLIHIYYRAFRNCKKLEAINIPEYVNTIGETCFYGCSSLRSVTVLVPDPSAISLGTNVFGGVPLSDCTLYVPYGSKTLYANANIWKNFGKIIEIRTHTQPKYSPVEADVAGYIMNLSTRKYLSLGEAYGTQSVVASSGKLYQFKRSKSMDDGQYYLYSDETGQSGKVLFRTDTDTKVGSGVKACFGDGSLSTKAYWKVEMSDGNIFTLQVPDNDKSYTEGEYLGVDENHKSDFASPTFGVYWDVKGDGCRWVFITAEDLKAARQLDDRATLLADMLKRAKADGVDVAAEQSVYDNFESTVADINAAIVSVRSKLHYITFADSRTQTLCVDKWDTDGDGELSIEEAAAVTSIGDAFQGIPSIRSFEELRYFTSLTEIPENAFRGASLLQTIYLPAGVTAIGDYAFRNCSALKNLVLLNETVMVPMGLTSVPNGCSLFVPAKTFDYYSADPDWSSRCTVIEYTGHPVVTAEASRIYGRTFATIYPKVLGAPVEGTPETSCESISVSTTPVGTYPIQVSAGTVTTLGVEFREGVFTVEPAQLTVTAQSYTRMIGEENPVFEFSCKGFRNRETDTVFTVRPVIACEATASSPAGEYDIVVSGGEARNYTITYVNGKLTVVNDPTGIQTLSATHDPQPVYDLQGRRISQLRRGIYIRGKRKVVMK